MKQTWKKIISLVLISICVLAMTACGSEKKAAVGSLQEPDENTKASLVESFGAVVENIAQLDTASIESYMAGDDAFSAAAATAWDANGEDLGAYKESKGGDVVVKNNQFELTLNCVFEKREANCVFTLDKNGTPTSVSIDPVYSMAEKMEQAGMNTITGLITVFVMLVFLCFVISLMKYIPGFVESFNKKKSVPEAVPAAETVQEMTEAAAEEESIDDGALVAVIAAAIAAAENTSTDSFTVRSIRKSTKRNWQRA